MTDDSELETTGPEDAAEDDPEDPEGEDQELLAVRTELDARTAENRDLLERLRQALLASDPTIAPELVSGDTAEAIETSFAAARKIVAGVRDAVQREGAGGIPAGAPGRVRAAPRTALEKIRSGLAARA